MFCEKVADVIIGVCVKRCSKNLDNFEKQQVKHVRFGNTPDKICDYR